MRPRTSGRASSTRWSATTSASTVTGRAASASDRCSACSPTSRSPASTCARCPGAAAVEMGHNFSLVHDDIEDRGPERRHRPALWTVSGVPQAINTGDTLFTLSRHGAPPPHRRGLLGREGPRPDAPLRRDLPRAVRRPVHGHLDAEHDEWLSVDCYFDMIGRKTAALIAGSAQAGAMLATDDEAIIVGVPPLRLVARPRLPAQRRPARASGATSRRPARRPPTSRSTRRRCR